MKMRKAYRRIVVATDFSAGSRSAFGAVEALAGKGSLTVHIVHVLEPISDLVPIPASLRARERTRHEKARRQLQRFAAALERRLGGGRIHTELASGPVEVQVCRLADRLRADLVVICSHGRTGVRRAVLGSTAERVARFARRPVLIVPLAGGRRRVA